MKHFFKKILPVLFFSGTTRYINLLAFNLVVLFFSIVLHWLTIINNCYFHFFTWIQVRNLVGCNLLLCKKITSLFKTSAISDYPAMLWKFLNKFDEQIDIINHMIFIICNYRQFPQRPTLIFASELLWNNCWQKIQYSVRHVVTFLFNF